MELLNRVNRGLERTREGSSRTGIAVGLGAASLSILAFFIARNQPWSEKRPFGRKVRDIMTKSPIHSTRGTTLHDVARLMVERDCGEIPVVDDLRRPIGVITDRDIVCRTLARGINPLNVSAESIMTSPIKTVNQDASINECLDLMEENQIRRVLVVDERDTLCGVVSQADISRMVGRRKAANVVERVSQPTAA